MSRRSVPGGRAIYLACVLAAGSGASPCRAFVAYNDHVAGPGTHPNATLYGADGEASGPLRDIETGEALPVVLTTSALAVSYASQTASPASGTDAAAVFDGYVDFTPNRPHSLELTFSSAYEHALSGLDPSRRYDFTGTAVRGRDGYTDRWTLLTLEGADSYTPAHSVGPGVVTEGLWPFQAALWTGENHRANQGFVVRWTDIDPGPDGTFKVISQQYRGPTPGVGTGDSTAGGKGYGLNGIRLIEMVVAGRPVVENLPASAITSSAARLAGRVLDPGADPPAIALYYGPEDGGKMPANWQHSVELGAQAGAFDVRVEGLEPGTQYFYRCYARNSVAGAWSPTAESFNTLAGSPQIVDEGSAELMAFSALVAGRVESTGGDPPGITLFWGPQDGGEAPAAWAASAELGVQDAAFSFRLEGLAPATPYSYRWRAANSAATVWTPVPGQFTTSALGMPAVALNPVQGVSDRSAVVTGAVTDAGGDPPQVDLFFGPTDGGPFPEGWLASLALGLQASAFRGTLTGLAPLTRYHVRARARNATGESWSARAEAFQTLAELAVSVVINEIHYHTADKTSLSEFVELYNASDALIDLSGWSLTGGVEFLFPDGAQLAPGAFLVVTENLAGFRAAFGTTAYGQWRGGLRLDNEGERVELVDAARRRIDTVEYQPGFPWPNQANGGGSSMELVHPLLDNDLGGSWRSSQGGPTPGRRNSVFAQRVAPQLRQVDHAPQSPRPGQDVTVTVKATDADGVARVTLSYQLVEPGDYISLADPRYAAGWTDLAMRDDGRGGDQLAGDAVYSAVLPGAVLTHRRLARYRITAEDGLGDSVRVPYPDDPVPNFACFAYDGVPAWTGSARPGATQPVTYDSQLLSSIPVYHLLTTRRSHEEAMSIPNSRAGQYWGEEYPWLGTLVYDGRVYDHIRFRARGGVWRYSMGKNMWKFDFNRSHDFAARDDYGRPYRTTWKKLNFSALIQQGNFGQRGEQGLFEGAGFRLHNLAGNPAPYTHYAHFRIVESASESGAGGSQYDTDFQGLYMVIEQPDGRFLDEHALPDGNFYKMEGGTGELNNQGPTQPADKSDLNAFLTYQSQTKPVSWWEQNLDLGEYYSFRTVLLAIHDYDSHAGKNYFYYHNPETGIWSVINWDLDLTWTTTYDGGGGRDPLNDYVFRHEPFSLELRNRAREIRDLLFNPEQTGMLLDEIARVVYRPGQPSLVDADRAMWDYNPILVSSYINLSKAGHGRFYESAVPRTFAGMLQKQKSYVESRGRWMDSTMLTDDAAVPRRPVVTALNAQFPLDDLVFETSAFSSPGGQAFAAMEWRIAAVTDPAITDLYATFEPPLYEIEATWRSDELASFEPRITIPADSVKIGQLYRVRVRMKDQAGRWSHWSDPLQFVAAAPANWAQLRSDLLITEVMYNPAGAAPAEAAAGFERSDFEFIELYNRGPTAIDLRSIRFTKGIDFDFAAGEVVDLAPGAYALVVRRRDAFELRYGGGLPIAGEYGPLGSDDRLADGGERLKLSFGAGNALVEFEYDDDAPWPWQADGEGYSLTLRDPEAAVEYADPLSWKASLSPGGTPGAPDGLTLQAWKSLYFTAEELADPTVSGDAADPDADDCSNYAEFRAGTHPRDGGSALRMGGLISLGAPGFQVRWDAVSGRTYRVQYRDDLAGGDWLDLPGGPWTASANGTMAVTDPDDPPGGQRFYRVVVE